MSANQKKKIQSGISAGSVKKVVRKAAKRAVRKTETALAIVKDRLPAGSRVVKQASRTVKSLPSRTKRLVKSHPVRVLLGASAIGFVLAKLKRLV